MLDINGFIKRVGLKGHEELAEKLGTTRKAVSSWSCGDRKPGYDMIDKLYKLGMTTEEIFGFPYRSSVMSVGEMETEAAGALERLKAIIGKI